MPGRVLVAAICMIAGMFAESRATREFTDSVSASSSPVPPRAASRGVAESVRSGSWGRIESSRIILTPTPAMLRDTRIGSEAPRWVVPGVRRKDFARVLTAAAVPDSVVARWIDPRHSSEFPEGLGLAPTCPMIRNLGQEGLAAVYALLARDSANVADRWEMPSRYIATLRDFGIPESVPEEVRALSVSKGAMWVSYCLPCAFVSGVPESAKAAFLGAMSQQTSREASLRVDARDDTRRLAEYWGAGRTAADRKRLEEILARAAHDPAGGAIPLASLLPPFPASLLNTFPKATRADAGARDDRNCSWTAMNFFRQRPDPRFGEAAHVVAILSRDYRQVTTPRFGDVAVFVTSDDYLLHVATYVAGDLYFTKNGSNALHPWVLNTLREMDASFAETLPRGQSLSVRYYRAKAPEPKS